MSARRPPLPSNRTLALLVCLCAFLAPVSSFATTIRDVAKFHGIDANVLVGRGIVVGLAGTGDSSVASQEMLYELLRTFEAYGENLEQRFTRDQLKSKSVAIVSVTAVLDAFQKEGDQVDVEVATLFDAKSLAGGTLYFTPLRSPGGGAGRPAPMLAFAQGPLTVGAALPTSGQVRRGAVVTRTAEQIPQNYFRADRVIVEVGDLEPERRAALLEAVETGPGQYDPAPIGTWRGPHTLEIRVPEPYQERPEVFAEDLQRAILPYGATVAAVGRVALVLERPGFYNVHNLAEQINRRIESQLANRARLAIPRDTTTLDLYVPMAFVYDRVAFLAQVESWPAPVLAQEERVLVDERAGTVAVTGNVRVLPGFVAIGAQQIEIRQEMSLIDFLSNELAAPGAMPVPGGPTAPDAVRQGLLATPDLIRAIRKLDEANLITGRVEVR